MKDTPIDYEVVSRRIKESKLPNLGRASIREIKKLINEIEAETGQKYIRMEMGVPGLPAVEIGIQAEMEALKRGAASIYPEIDGVPELKYETARFIKLFLDVDVNPENCIPTVGSMQGGYATFMTVNRMYTEKDTTLMLDPCFPVHKQQHAVIGTKFEAFDVYEYRGDKLKDKIESYLKKGNIASIMYSNPNNPSWICFTDKELRTIAELANKYNVIVIEDLAYFAMDFRKDYSKPGLPPHQPSVAKYTDNFILLVSSSKAFSYAGQRIGMMIISPKLWSTVAPDLKRYYVSDNFGRAMLFGTIYSLSAGTAHTAQFAMAAILKAVNDGKFNFVEIVKEYGEKAKIMKKMFLDNGFKIVYDKDENEPIADGFYFTFSYPEFSGEQLLEELMYYGISAISLAITGSDRSEGMRACVSLVNRKQFPDLESRLKKFHEHHKVN
jgi:aspartate/methionine/tyrosine aminotransferase